MGQDGPNNKRGCGCVALAGDNQYCGTATRCIDYLLNFDVVLGLEEAENHKINGSSSCPLVDIFAITVGALAGRSKAELKATSLIQEGDTLTHRHLAPYYAAADQYLNRKHYDAISSWLAILTDDRSNVLALKFLTTACFYVGDCDTMSYACRLAMECVEERYVHHVWAMLAFALSEKNQCQQAEHYASKAIEIQNDLAWGIHAMSHVYLEQSRFQEGIELLAANNSPWKAHDDLACHIYWHWAMFYVYSGETDQALDLYDREIIVRTQKSMAFPMDVADAVSLLVRLELFEKGVGPRWAALHHLTTHNVPMFLAYPFTAAHYIVLECHIKGVDSRKFLAQALNSLVDQTGQLKPFFTALHSYCKKDDINRAFMVLFYHISSLRPLGGSNAQRDVFNLMAIDAGIRSCNHGHVFALIVGKTRGWIQNQLIQRRCCSCKNITNPDTAVSDPLNYSDLKLSLLDLS